MNKPITFTTGGTVQAGDGTYLRRQADDTLMNLCRKGDYAYVLTTRQMGKSSLMVATSRKLVAEGIQAAIVDLQGIGKDTTTADQWYIGVLEKITEAISLDAELKSWWYANQHLGQVDRMMQFLEKVVLSETEDSIVVFVDEIDIALSLDYTDDFFIALRYCYSARADKSAFKRLSFVLIGVATPSQLIKDHKRTPFNIGTLVELTDFTQEQAMDFATGLGLPKSQAQKVLRWILEWTGGHPYLTQKVCKTVMEAVKQGRADWTAKTVEEIVKQLFFGKDREQLDSNLSFVENWLIDEAPKAAGKTHKDAVMEVLGTYEKILNKRPKVYDEDRSPKDAVMDVLRAYKEILDKRPKVHDEAHSLVEAHLKLSGVVKPEQQTLRVRNRIYENVFDNQWISQQWPQNWLIRNWPMLKVATPVAVVFTVLLAGFIRSFIESRSNEDRAISKDREVRDKEALNKQKDKENQQLNQENQQLNQENQQLNQEKQELAQQLNNLMAASNSNKTNGDEQGSTE